MKKKKILLPSAFGVAAVWFGSHAGAGFATGRQEVNFFVQFGWNSIWIGLFSMSIMAIVLYLGMDLARIYKVNDYKNFFNKFYHPYQKIFANLWDILYIYATLLGASVAIAGAADLIDRPLNIPYPLAVVLISAILLIFTIFGSGLVRKASVFMSLFIIISLLIITFLGIRSGAGNLENIVSRKITTAGIGHIFWMALLYGAFQSVIIAPVISVSENLKTRKSCFQAAFFGFLLNGVMLVLVCIMLLGFFPEINKESLPVYFVTTKLNIPSLYFLYSFILFFALISTGVNLIFGVVKRFEVSWKNGSGIFQIVKIKRAAVSIMIIAFATGISMFGLTAIVAKGYGSLGFFAIFLNIIPILILAPLKIRRARKLKTQSDQENL